jgi:hypothetical protein
MTSFPPNFISIVDAFDQAVAKLVPVDIVRWAEAPIEEDFAGFDQDKLDELDQATRKIERLFRDALADGYVKAWVKNPATGLMEELIDDVSGREAWRQMAVGYPALSCAPIT